MTDRLLPAPDENGPRSASASGGSAKDDPNDAHDQRKSRAKPRIASEEECLAALTSLPGLLVMGMLNIQQVTSLRAVYATVLQHYQRRHAGAARQTLEIPGLAERLREHPELANMLAPLLSEEQLAIIMADGKEEPDAAT